MHRQIILDTETTGLDPLKGHRLTEIGCLELVNRKLTGASFQTYLNPERELDSRAAEITGLSYEFLKDKPKFIQVAEALVNFIQDSELIIHNASFDLGFLNHELKLIHHYYAPIEGRLDIIDTLKMARKIFPSQRNDLDSLCRRYKIDNSTRKYHGALLDSEILAQVYLHMTAGQTHFLELLKEETQNNVNHKNIKCAPLRSSHTPLKVLLATHEELAAHEKRISKLRDINLDLIAW